MAHLELTYFKSDLDEVFQAINDDFLAQGYSTVEFCSRGGFSRVPRKARLRDRAAGLLQAIADRLLSGGTEEQIEIVAEAAPQPPTRREYPGSMMFPPKIPELRARIENYLNRAATGRGSPPVLCLSDLPVLLDALDIAHPEEA